ncbi:hypothetical protein [Atopobacter phocae]|uniref:hypothetical protein n=1 Tax=Atopobacter phocae TaxID=136492 RepID=UPI000472878C|nr:hypothetical protein [Atopobacter phocae]
MNRRKYKKPSINRGDLRIPVSFYVYQPSEGPDPDEEKQRLVFKALALAYSPSTKDMNIINAKGTKEGLTIKIRDPHTDFIPNNKHKVIVDDYRYGKDKVWEVLDVSPDFEDNKFIKIVLGAMS